MEVFLALCFVLHFLLIGVIMGFFGDRALKPKVVGGVFAYFFMFHVVAGFALRRGLDAFDPRTPEYMQWKEEVMNKADGDWKPTHYDFYED